MADDASRSPLLQPGTGDSELYDDEHSVQYRGLHKRTDGKITWFIVVLTGFSAVGMFLFGYDTGVVSGSMLLIKKQFNLSLVWESAIVSVTIGVAAVFAFLGGPLNELIGRKYSGICSGILFAVGAVILGVARDKVDLLLGRIVVGVGLGISSMTLPMYVSECAPSHVRGRLVQISGTFGTIGFLISNVVDGLFSYDDVNGWRYMLGLAALPSLLMTVGFIFLPESPRWLVGKRKIDRAKKVLERMRNSDDVTDELILIKRSCEDTDQNKGFFTVIRILRHPPTARALVVGCSLQMFQQVAGINTIICEASELGLAIGLMAQSQQHLRQRQQDWYYTATVIKSAGITDDHYAIWLSAGVAAINVLFSIVGLSLVDKIGRRKLLFSSYLGVIASLIMMSVGFQLVAMHSPRVNIHENNSSCSRYRLCEGCTRFEECGFCFTGDTANGINGSCLPVDQNTKTFSAFGRCSETNISSAEATWAYDYCPTPQFWIPLVGICCYIVSFAPGLAGIPWLMNAEMYPPWARSTGNALSTATNWFFNVLVSMTFLSLGAALTKFGVYWLYTGISIVGLIFLAYVLPETKGKSLEEMEQLFERPWC